MLKEAIYHKIDSDYAYPVSKDKFFCKIRTKKGDCSEVTLLYYDKYKYMFGDKREYRKIMEKKASDDLFDYYEAVVQVDMISIYYLFELKSEEVSYYSNYKFYDEKPENDTKFFNMPFLWEKDIFEIPEWANESIVYQIFVERFYSDRFTAAGIPDEWYGKVDYKTKLGGNLRGIIEKLNYLSELGINTIYLTPVFVSGSNHKYNTFDYFKIDPEFGTTEDIKELVKKAHDKGMRVIFDAVFNHSGHEFFAFKDVMEHGEKSKYKDWFDVREFPVKFEEPCNYATFGYFKWMPKLMTKNKETADYLIDVATYWIREADIDGWRLDVANEVDHDFWRRFRKEVKSVKKDALIIGEIWHDSSSWLQGDQLDTVMNYLFTGNVIEFAAKGGKPSLFLNSTGFMRGLYREQVYSVLWNLIDSHDTERFLHIAKGNEKKLKMAAVIQMTLGGVPMLYYGDEVGMTGGRDPDNRRGMYWDEKQNMEIFEFYKRIIAIRKENKELSNGDMKILICDDERNMLGYRREYNGRVIDIYINNDRKSHEIIFDGEEGEELLTGTKITKGEKVKIPSLGIMIIKR